MSKLEAKIKEAIAKYEEAGGDPEFYIVSKSYHDKAWAEALSEAQKVTGETSDGFHTFNELYEFRMTYNALLFNEWAKLNKYDVYKSKYHSDRKEPFGGGWFVVGANLPTGQVTNHYKMEHWGLFQVRQTPAADGWDGHTAQEALERLKGILESGDKHEI